MDKQHQIDGLGSNKGIKGWDASFTPKIKGKENQRDYVTKYVKRLMVMPPRRRQDAESPRV